MSKNEEKNKKTEEQIEENDQNDDIKEEFDKLNDKYLRLYADFDNYRKRVEKEIEDIKEATKRSLINDFLVILDNMEKALNISSDHKESIIEGIELTMKSFKDILKKHGVEEINPENEQFDPDFHDALMTQESKDLPKNTVMQTLEKGYRYKDRLIRPAKVIVSSGSKDGEAQQNTQEQVDIKIQTNNTEEE